MHIRWYYGFSLATQGILAAVLSGVLGSKDPEQITMMTKQAGEVMSITKKKKNKRKNNFFDKHIYSQRKALRLTFFFNFVNFVNIHIMKFKLF